MRLILPQKWASQPNDPVFINQSNPLGKKVAYSSTVASTYNIVKGQFGTLVNNPTIESSVKGLSRKFVTASSQGIDLPTDDIVSGYPLTVSVVVRMDAVDGQVVYSLNGTTYNAIMGPLGGNMAINTTSAPGFICIAGAPTGLVHIVTIHRNGSFDMYFNGVKQTQSSASNWGQPAAGNHSIGYRKAGASLRYFQGIIQDLTVFHGELSEIEIKDLTNDRYQIFQTPSRQFLGDIAAGGGTNMQINIADTFKTVTDMQINISDSWRTVVSVQINVGDTWRTVF